MTAPITPAPFNPGYALQDGNAINASLSNPLLSSQSGIVAFPSGTQTTATRIITRVGRVDTIASPGDAVKLPQAIAGEVIYLQNNAGNTMTVFASGTDTINNIAGSTGVLHGSGLTIAYVCPANGTWYTLSSSSGLTSNNVFGPGNPTTNGLPVWQDPLTPGSDGDTLVNTNVTIDPISGDTLGFGSIGMTGDLNGCTSITGTGSISGFTTIAAANLVGGASGTAGTLTVYAPTLNSGNILLQCANNSANYGIILTNASFGQASTITIPDPGNAAASVVLTKGTQTISGALTLTQTLNGLNYVAGSSGTAGAVTLYPSTAASGVLVLSATNSGGNFVTTITNAAQAAARTYSIIDAGGNANFVMSEGIQTINGALTLSANLDASTIVSGSSGSAGGISVFPATAASGNILYSAANNGGNFLITVTNASFGQATVLTYPDPGSSTAKFVFAKTSGAFVLTAGAATVADANITTGGGIFLGLQTPGGSIAGTPYVDTITPGVGFTVTGGGAGNTSTIAYYSLVGF